MHMLKVLPVYLVYLIFLKNLLLEEKAARGVHEKASAQKKALIIALEVRKS